MTISFSGFTLDPETRQLAEGPRVLHLSPKAFSLLALLVERRPAVVQKGEIATRIWPDVTVSDASLGGLVKEIRRALGDDPVRPTFIRTAHTVGYAFIGRVDGDPAARSGTSDGSYRCWLAWDDKALSLAPGENVIGRDPRSTVWLDASGVSRRHARVVVDAGSAFIEDLGSRNGTAVSGRLVSGPCRLEDGDAIDIGATTLTFRQWSEDRAPRTEALGPRQRRRS